MVTAHRVYIAGHVLPAHKSIDVLLGVFSFPLEWSDSYLLIGCIELRN
jgi:hypothetical protein